MNKTYKTKWNATLGHSIVTSELAKSHTKTKVASIVIATVFASSFTGSAVASNNIYTGPEARDDQKVIQNENGITTIEGDAYLNGRFNVNKFDRQEMLIRGDLLEATNQTIEGHKTEFLLDRSSATVINNIDIHHIRLGGNLKVGGETTVNKLTFIGNGSFTNLNGEPYSGLTVREEIVNQKTDDLHLNNLTLMGNFVNQGGDVELSGQIGTQGNECNLQAKTEHSITVNSNAVISGASGLNNGNIIIKGTLYGSNDANEVKMSGDGTSTIQANDVVMHNDGTVTGIKLKANSLTINGTAANEKYGSFTVGAVGGSPEGVIDVKRLVLNDNVRLYHYSSQEPLKVDTLVLNTTDVSSSYLQSKAAMEFGELIVQTNGRIYGYSDGVTLNVDKVVVAEQGLLALTSKFDSAGQIGSMVLGEGAQLNNGEFYEGTGRRGFNTTVTHVTGTNVDIVNEHGALELGTKSGSVNLSATINDKTDGVSVTLNQKSKLTVTGQSRVGSIDMIGGLTDMSKTDADLSITNLTGTGGTIVIDAAKSNAVIVTSADSKTQVEVKASENSDTVTIDQAGAMVSRLEGVTNKTGRVDEGMYNGVITVDEAGNAVMAKNDLMTDTLELASASTLSLNRVLMNDVRKRLGDIRASESDNGVWARYDGGKLSGEGTENKFNTLHIGGDMSPFADNSNRLGVSVSYTKGEVDYTRGSSDLDAYSFAAYGTWMGGNGMFADVIARLAKSESDMTVDGTYNGNLKNMAYSLSGEIGWRFDFNSMLYAEPQIEATYTYIDSDKMTLSGNGQSYNYSVDSFDSLIGRMGVLAGMKCPNQKGDVYVRASLVHEFMGDAKINGGHMTTIENNGKDTWVEYGIGANFNLSKNTYVWADIERTSGALVDEDIRGTVGIRFGF